MYPLVIFGRCIRHARLHTGAGKADDIICPHLFIIKGKHALIVRRVEIICIGQADFPQVFFGQVCSLDHGFLLVLLQRIGLVAKVVSAAGSARVRVRTGQIICIPYPIFFCPKHKNCNKGVFPGFD